MAEEGDSKDLKSSIKDEQESEEKSDAQELTDEPTTVPEEPSKMKGGSDGEFSTTEQAQEAASSSRSTVRIEELHVTQSSDTPRKQSRIAQIWETLKGKGTIKRKIPAVSAKPRLLSLSPLPVTRRRPQDDAPGIERTPSLKRKTKSESYLYEEPSPKEPKSLTPSPPDIAAIKAHKVTKKLFLPRPFRYWRKPQRKSDKSDRKSSPRTTGASESFIDILDIPSTSREILRLPELGPEETATQGNLKANKSKHIGFSPEERVIIKQKLMGLSENILHQFKFWEKFSHRKALSPKHVKSSSDSSSADETVDKKHKRSKMSQFFSTLTPRKRISKASKAEKGSSPVFGKSLDTAEEETSPQGSSIEPVRRVRSGAILDRRSLPPRPPPPALEQYHPQGSGIKPARRVAILERRALPPRPPPPALGPSPRPPHPQDSGIQPVTGVGKRTTLDRRLLTPPPPPSTLGQNLPQDSGIEPTGIEGVRKRTTLDRRSLSPPPPAPTSGQNLPQGSSIQPVSGVRSGAVLDRRLLHPPPLLSALGQYHVQGTTVEITYADIVSYIRGIANELEASLLEQVVPEIQHPVHSTEAVQDAPTNQSEEEHTRSDSEAQSSASNTWHSDPSTGEESTFEGMERIEDTETSGSTVEDEVPAVQHFMDPIEDIAGEHIHRLPEGYLERDRESQAAEWRLEGSSDIVLSAESEEEPFYERIVQPSGGSSEETESTDTMIFEELHETELVVLPSTDAAEEPVADGMARCSKTHDDTESEDSKLDQVVPDMQKTTSSSADDEEDATSERVERCWKTDEEAPTVDSAVDKEETDKQHSKHSSTETDSSPSSVQLDTDDSSKDEPPSAVRFDSD